MIYLIAESKTMTACDIPASVIRRSSADEVMRHLSTMDVADIAAALKVSVTMAASVKEMAYEFPNNGLGAPAGEAYTGVVFKAFDYMSLPPSAREWCDRHVRIVSSLYGLLRPTDIIKRYRLDYGVRLAPDGATMSAWLREGVTDALIASGEKGVVDLMPGDAARCVDRRRLEEAGMAYVPVDFRTWTSAGGVMKTPPSTRLKTLRGLLLRAAALSAADTLESLASLSSDDFMPAEPDDTRRLLFLS